MPEPIVSEVVVTDIKMKFLSMVVFMIKWALASIPATLIILFSMLFMHEFFGAVSDEVREAYKVAKEQETPCSVQYTECLKTKDTKTCYDENDKCLGN